MKISAMGSCSFESQVMAAGFFSQSATPDIWVALSNGDIYLLSSSLEAHKIGTLDLTPLDDAFYLASADAIVGVGRGGIRIYDFERSEAFDPCPYFSERLYKAAPSSDTTIICGGSHEILQEVDLSNCRVKEIAFCGEGLTSISIHPDGQQVLYSQAADKCYTAVAQVGGGGREISEFRMQKTTSVFDPSGTRLLQLNKYVHCATFPEVVPLWCFSEQKGFVKYKDEEDWEHSYEWSTPVFLPDSSKMLCGSYSGQIHCWDIKKPALLCSIQAHQCKISCLSFNAQKQQSISAGVDGSLELWQLHK